MLLFQSEYKSYFLADIVIFQFLHAFLTGAQALSHVFILHISHNSKFANG